ncbi:MAG: bifunctional (p)ppGpp synthetase/guanosine-3',5'-bis(diphosphate) 3'-pyrophosphohydrolase [Bacteroidales bacterium]|nr:bifunctional (p)ppGpp synthetase/guanosine-3',5'-bis(diphosphate) 3'-pyrophosphohydrolase [Bacteroidales bacterium]
MQKDPFFTTEERLELLSLYRKLLYSNENSIDYTTITKLRQHLTIAIQSNKLARNNFNMNPVIRDLKTALIVSEEIGMKGNAILSILLHEAAKAGEISMEQIIKEYGDDVATIIKGLVKTNDIYKKSAAVESENFRNLLLSFAEDMRVILIMIADRVNIMRNIRDTANVNDRTQVAQEAAYLYAPLAHKLGLYTLKSELEDLSLKYLEPDTYYGIRDQLNQTKASRDRYIATFISPIKENLIKSNLKFEIKGRTKSIHSIWNKIQRQQTPFENIYDLFAIRIILDSEPDKEKQECWQVYSIVTDMYQPNPNRLRDWLSIPKSNGYESLHITVMGPEGRWVEVQIRTKRMDAIAERGLAAHWRYKGIKGESGLDDWLNSVREALDNQDNDSLEVMDQFKMDLYEDEVFVFTPKGDLFKLRKGSTVLDFAFQIHTNIGAQCVGARVNGKHAQLKQKLKSGDQVEILTSSTQTPKLDWLNIVTTSKARSKIRQALKEIEAKQFNFVKETFERKLKNRKLEFDEPVMNRLIKKLGFKKISSFYQKLADNTLEINEVIDQYANELKRENDPHNDITYRSAENYNLQQQLQTYNANDDELVIDKELRGLDYSLAKCCNPIYGDKIFGFVTVTGGVKIHRVDCPNAKHMRKRFGYRFVKARWAGKAEGKHYPITLRVVGHDDIGIVTNITSIISKEDDVSLRSIRIDSNDGLFSGMLTIMVSDKSKLTALIKKIKSVKGVKSVIR